MIYKYNLHIRQVYHRFTILLLGSTFAIIRMLNEIPHLMRLDEVAQLFCFHLFNGYGIEGMSSDSGILLGIILNFCHFLSDLKGLTLEVDAEVVHEELLVVDMLCEQTDRRVFLESLLTFKEHVTHELLIDGRMRLDAFCVWVSVAELLPCPNVSLDHVRVFLELLDAFLVESQRAAHAT